jgi:hypothetical protein
MLVNLDRLNEYNHKYKTSDFTKLEKISKISIYGAELIEKMLISDPNKRISIEECLDSYWLSGLKNKKKKINKKKKFN